MMKYEPLKVKCERCGRIRPLFQYNFFDTRARKWEIVTVERGEMKRREMLVDNSRGLCEECAVEVNKKKYDDLSK